MGHVIQHWGAPHGFTDGLGLARVSLEELGMGRVRACACSHVYVHVGRCGGCFRLGGSSVCGVQP